VTEIRRTRVLTRSLLLGIGMLIALIGGNTLLTQNRSDDQRTRATRVSHTLADLEHLNAILALLEGAQAAQRGFILTGDPYYLEPYASARRGLGERLDALQELAGGDAAQMERVVRLRQLGDERLAQLDAVIAASEQLGFLAARQALIDNRHKATMADIGTQLAAMRKAESALLATEIETAESSYRWAFSLNVVAGALALLVLATLVFLVERNLRAREVAAAEILRQREALRITVASIGDGVITTDNHGQVLYLNGEAEKLTGWATDDAAGLPLERIFRIVNERTHLAVENPATRALRDGVIVGLDHHTVLVAKDGVERSIDDIAAPIRDPLGRVAGVVLIFRDVSEERAATNRLRELAAELSDADRRKNEFLALLAHEIRNPLAAIRNSVAVVRLADNNPGARAVAHGAIDRQMEHLVRLVEDLVDVARINRGKLALRRERVDLRQALEQALEACRPAFAGHQQALGVALPHAPVYLYADAMRITQVIGNLLSNASKFTARGGTVQISITVEDADAVLRIRDNGIGIAAEHLPRLFEMFSQLDNSLERPQRGLGIGLSLAKQLVQMHGGRLEAHSAGVGRGSEFAVFLPTLVEEDLVAAAATDALARGVAEDAEHGGADAVALAPSSLAGRRILVVDDNVDSADSLAVLLRLQGYEAAVAHDGLTAVEMALRTLPHVVLLDIGLPGLNGYEVARRLRDSPQGAGMQLIALTGWGEASDRKLARAAGFDEHLVKPVNHDRLLALLARPSATAVLVA
jgi:PAS domain S-box-containing protein